MRRGAQLAWPAAVAVLAAGCASATASTCAPWQTCLAYARPPATSRKCEFDWHLCQGEADGLAKEYYAASSKTRSSAQMLMCQIYTMKRVNAPDSASGKDGVFSRLDDEVSFRVDAARRSNIQSLYGKRLSYKTLLESALMVGGTTAVSVGLSFAPVQLATNALERPTTNLRNGAYEALRQSADDVASAARNVAETAGETTAEGARHTAERSGVVGRAALKGGKAAGQAVLHTGETAHQGALRGTGTIAQNAARSGGNVAGKLTWDASEHAMSGGGRSLLQVADSWTNPFRRNRIHPTSTDGPDSESDERPGGETPALVLKPSDLLLPPAPTDSVISRSKTFKVLLYAVNSAIGTGLNALVPFLSQGVKLIGFLYGQGLDVALDKEFRQCLACHALSPPQVLYDILNSGELPTTFCGKDVSKFMGKAEGDSGNLHFSQMLGTLEQSRAAARASDDRDDQAFAADADVSEELSITERQEAESLLKEIQDEVNTHLLAGMVRQVIIGFVLANTQQARALMAARRVADGKFVESALDTYMANTNDLMKEVFKDQFGKADRFWHAIVRGLTIGQDKLLLTLSTDFGSSLERHRKGFRKGLAFVTINRFLRALDQSQHASATGKVLHDLKPFEQLRKLPKDTRNLVGQLPMYAFCDYSTAGRFRPPLFEVMQQGILPFVRPGVLSLAPSDARGRELLLVTNAKPAYRDRMPYLSVWPDAGAGVAEMRHYQVQMPEGSEPIAGSVFGALSRASEQGNEVTYQSLGVREIIRSAGTEQDVRHFNKACSLLKGTFSTRSKITSAIPRLPQPYPQQLVQRAAVDTSAAELLREMNRRGRKK